MWIMIAGPYRSGVGEPSENLAALNQAALAVFRRGHVPVVGVNAALPLINVAGETAYDELMLPLSLALADRCDACLRIGGPSAGADAEVTRFHARGLPVFDAIDALPKARKDDRERLSESDPRRN